MWQRYCFLAVLFVVFPFSLLAQHVSLTGKVLDEKSGKPVEYASVLLQAQDLWAITNEKGRFTIKQVPQGDYAAAPLFEQAGRLIIRKEVYTSFRFILVILPGSFYPST